MYIIGLYLKSKSIEEAIDILKNRDIMELYGESYCYLESFISKTKLYYYIMLNNLINSVNYFYNSTLRDGIKAFFKVYNYSYDALNNVITTDYDLCVGRINLCGIEYINKYIECVNYENIFCKKFNDLKIDSLLKKRYGNYKSLPINIFKEVFLGSLLLNYFNKVIYSLDIFSIDISILYSDYEKGLFIKLLKDSYINLLEKLSLSKCLYYDKCFKIVNDELLYFFENKSLEKFFMRCNTGEIMYVLNNKMSDKEFNLLISNVVNSSDRVSMVLNNSKSLLDVLDIIREVYFSSCELLDIFKHLSIIEIMVLKKFYSDNFCDNNVFDELNRYISTLSYSSMMIINNNYMYVKIIMDIN